MSGLPVVVARVCTTPSSAWLTDTAALPAQPSTGKAITIPEELGPPLPILAANPPANDPALLKENGPAGWISNVETMPPNGPR